MKAKYSLSVVFIMFATILFFTVSSDAKIDPKTVAGMWLFNEGKGNITNDSSINGNHGELMRGPKWDKGKFGNAITFDGASTFVNCGNGPSLDITKAITVMAWVKFEGVDYKNSKGGLFSIGAKGYPDSLNPHAGWWFSYDNRNNRQGFPYTCFGNKNGGWAGGGNSFSGYNFEFNNGEWNHLAFTIGQSIAKLYINGTKIGADKALANLVLSDTSVNLSIGSSGNNGWYFNGTIDEVAIFNVALDEENIKNAMNAGLEKSTSLSAVNISGKLINTWANIKSR
ncbi:LamG domain-containing protein [Candidatus Poribacteria bacterium]|nr:LamG domain-containing protein [Candidatus Poribacteria bacterium]